MSQSTNAHQASASHGSLNHQNGTGTQVLVMKSEPEHSEQEQEQAFGAEEANDSTNQLASVFFRRMPRPTSGDAWS